MFRLSGTISHRRRKTCFILYFWCGTFFSWVHFIPSNVHTHSTVPSVDNINETRVNEKGRWRDRKKHVYYIVILTDINNNKPNNWTADKIYACAAVAAAVLFYFHRLVDASIWRVSRASSANLVKTKRLYISHSLIFRFRHSIIFIIDHHRNDLSHLHFHWIISNVIVA